MLYVYVFHSYLNKRIYILKPSANQKGFYQFTPQKKKSRPLPIHQTVYRILRTNPTDQP